MRLICGLVRLDGSEACRSILDAMIEALTPPGLAPRVDTRADGRAAFATLDFSRLGRPVDSHLTTDAEWLAADLRLDRPQQLADRLGLPGDASAHSLAAAALARWGADLPGQLDGDFALAAWHPGDQRLVCARDIMGVRPLCYAHVAGRFLAFASLPEALQVPGLVPRRIDRHGLARLAVEHYANVRNTGYEGIEWLEAGHSLVLSSDGLSLHRGWRPDAAIVGTWRGTAEDAAQQLRRLLIDAVRQRVGDSGDVAAHLSGGLDSSSLAVLAARLLRPSGRRLHGYSLLARQSVESGLLDERAYVEAILAQEPDIAWSAIEGGSILPDDLRPPLSGAPPGPDDRICADAHAAGCEVVISGAGGDETATYAGEALHATLFRKGHWTTLHTELKSRARREARSLAHIFLRRVVAPLTPDMLRGLRRRLIKRQPPAPPDRSRFLAPDLRAPFVAQAIRSPARHTGRERLALLTSSYVVGRNVRWAAIGARHGIAFVFPMLDRRVIDFVLSLPLTHLVGEGYTRQPLRTAMRGILPEVIRRRESKFVPFPDAPLTLAHSKQALLTQVDHLRGNAEVAALFDIEAIAHAIAEAPEGAEALAAARAFNRVPMPPKVRRALDAVQALRLALQATGGS